MKVKAKIDVSATLRQSIRIASPNKTYYNILLKYEKLGVYCRCCGYLGHEARNCDLFLQLSIAESEVNLNWRADLRVDQLGWRVSAAKENTNPNSRDKHLSFTQANKKSTPVSLIKSFASLSYWVFKCRNSEDHRNERSTETIELEAEIGDNIGSKVYAAEGEQGANPEKAPTGQ
ncbi:hypothetical protein PIB30_006906 [Stylosanthes scabra]|uniref:Zinc knuckle CX2CX4HX4C domain-containing protein n=1 Tax=Stylosanthes scabra TaxID=79078 RepID=A0ABU6X1S8_9FABA|nr:hypothetical protein [Stylosanthes scabra]